MPPGERVATDPEQIAQARDARRRGPVAQHGGQHDDCPEVHPSPEKPDRRRGQPFPTGVTTETESPVVRRSQRRRSAARLARIVRVVEALAAKAAATRVRGGREIVINGEQRLKEGRISEQSGVQRSSTRGQWRKRDAMIRARVAADRNTSGVVYHERKPPRTRSPSRRPRPHRWRRRTMMVWTTPPTVSSI